MPMQPQYSVIGNGFGPALGASITSLNMSTSPFQVLPLNTYRVGYVILNNSSNSCFIAFGTTASNTVYTYEMIGGSVLEPPPGQFYCGPITAVSASTTGTLIVTELTQ